MKSIILTIIIMTFSIGLCAQKYENFQVVMIGIGAKNPTFDETKYPNLTFYYTPELISKAEVDETAKSALSLFADDVTREVFEGKPEILAKWWDETDITHHAILFDKNGVGTWQGWIDRQEEIMDCNGFGDEEELADAFEYLFEDEEVTEFDEDKEFDYEDDDCLIETKIPDFNVVNLSGESVSVKSVVETGKTTMLVFFQIPVDVDLNASRKESDEDESVGGFVSNVLQTTAGDQWKKIMSKLQNQLFDNEVEN